MRNLSIWNVSVKHIDKNTLEKMCICYGHEEDKNQELYICTSNLTIRCFTNGENISWQRNLSEYVHSASKPIGITYLSLTNSLSVGLSNGELFTISENGNHCDLVGVCENGLLAMEWSPDQEILILVTTDLKVIVMSCTFDPINETNLISDDFGSKQFITVGWGKKETQFHGSEGKQAAKATDNVIEDSQANNGDIKISWRGDGLLFAIGFTMNGIRRFKVFNREGNLLYTSEKLQGIEANLSWRPSGNLIATTQKLPDKYVVAFFEKNGLKHGEFLIPVNTKTVVEDLLWSTDSEILTLVCKDIEKGSTEILLFTSSNYHWYLKQTLSFRVDQEISNIVWDDRFDINTKTMHVILQNGYCYTYSWVWNVDHSRGTDSNDDAIVTVIDGQQALINSFRQSVVPPPMSNTKIEFNGFINYLHFSGENNNSNSFILNTADKLFILNQTKKCPLAYEITNEYILEDFDFPFKYYNWYWLNDNILCVSVNESDSYSIVQFKIDKDILIKENEIAVPSAVTRICGHPSDSSKIFLQLDSGDILELTLYKDMLIPQDVSFPVSCIKFCTCSVDQDIVFLGLSHKGGFYVNDKLIMNNVNSFFVHTDYLLLTTLKHLLVCVELTQAGLDALASYEKNESGLVYTRKIERGAKLVIAVPNDTRTVFQMLRGNLEAIQPRPLSLKIIGGYLNSLLYNKAFDLMRKQRINLNLIYDHDPELFDANIDTFLKSIKNNSWLSLFLADLENTDVTKTMYSSSYTHRKLDDKTNVNCKISHVCGLIREHITNSMESSERILPLLTTYVKMNSISDLEQALLLIKKLKTQESEGVKLPVSSDEALKYLLYMVNVDNLFDVALGMYDFELVLLVANKSQKDPKEYIAMLNELNEMDENYKQFTINKHLKRFDKAVQCLAKCGEKRHEDLRTFVKYHSLYKEALAIFSNKDDIYKQISEDYGSYLRLKKQFSEAGLIYERAGNIDKAVECYKDALEWEFVFKLGKYLSQENLKDLTREIVNMLEEEKRYSEAITVLEQYGDDIEETINSAIRFGKYRTALRLTSQHNKSEKFDSKILENLLDEHDKLIDLININKDSFVRHKNRLTVVRADKKKKQEECYDTSYINKDMDLYSDAGSTIASSSGSGRSYRSSKNRRKHERKVASLKEGSQYEDTALIMALHSLVTSTFELRMQAREINMALCAFDKYSEATQLQNNLEVLLKEMRDSFKDIWNHELVLEATNASIAAENVPDGCSVIPQGIATLDPHIRIAPLVQNLNWKLEGLN